MAFARAYYQTAEGAVRSEAASRTANPEIPRQVGKNRLSVAAEGYQRVSENQNYEYTVKMGGKQVEH